MRTFDTATEFVDACVHEVAADIGRARLLSDHNSLPRDERFARWRAETEKATPEAIEKINAMTNMELLAVIGEAIHAQ